MMRPGERSIFLFGLCGVLLAAPGIMAASREKPPERARDLAYGAALYEYYQGDSFAALTELAVAEQRGGIRGHGDHPALLRGGMMLAYGMTRQAKAVFDALLKEKLSPSTRNLAWFYLAKIFYLERDFASATAAMVAIDQPLLAVTSADLHEEVLYMEAQIALARRDEEAYQAALDALPLRSVWRPYLQYNHAVLPATAGVLGETLARLQGVVIDDETPFTEVERLALRDRLHLSQASFQLDAGNHREAMSSFQNVRLAGPLSDQALFGYALATANEKEFGLSLQALSTLAERPLFNPWVQQVPYALGYLHEQLDDKERALQAYTEAAGRYRQLRDDLDRMIAGLSEEAILKAIEQAGPEARPVVLGDPSVVTDSYGRLRIRPADYNLAQRVASEAFQIGLRDLHELYLLRDRFRGWEQRLSAAEVMLQARQVELQQTREQAGELLRRHADADWPAREASWQRQVEEAEAGEDAAFFRDAEQAAAAARIEGLGGRIGALPDTTLQAELAEKLRRVEGYYSWWSADTLAVNRWQVRKALAQLSDAVKSLRERRARVESLLVQTEREAEFRDRIEAAKARLEALSTTLQEQIGRAQEVLMALVKEDLLRQRTEVVGYLVASQEARSRLIDEKYRAQQQAREAPPPTEPSGNGVRSPEQEPGLPQPQAADPTGEGDR